MLVAFIFFKLMFEGKEEELLASILFFYLKIFILSNLNTQHGAQTQQPQNQELHPLLAEPAGCPWLQF